MTNLVITKSGCFEEIGVPEIFVEDSDFVRLLEDRNLASEVYAYFGRNVCIGRLGRLNEGESFEEPDFEEQRIEISNAEEKMSFYERVR